MAIAECLGSRGHRYQLDCWGSWAKTENSSRTIQGLRSGAEEGLGF